MHINVRADKNDLLEPWFAHLKLLPYIFGAVSILFPQIDYKIYLCSCGRYEG